jgi:hypothetical protein
LTVVETGLWNLVVHLRLHPAIGADGADQLLAAHLDFTHRQAIPHEEPRREEDDDK